MGAPKAAKMGRRCPDRAIVGAKDVPSRRLQLFSEQFRKGNSQKLNFTFHDFCELRLYGVLRSSSFQKVKRGSRI
jgi:hypothetical protein